MVLRGLRANTGARRPQGTPRGAPPRLTAPAGGIGGLVALGVVLAALAGCSAGGRPSGAQGAGAPRLYTVVAGDTVYDIARRFNLPMREIIDTNGLRPPFILQIGQTLRLPGQRIHVVRPGDTVYAISRLYGVEMARLARRNGLGADYLIRVDQRLVIPLSREADPGTGGHGASDSDALVAGAAPLGPPPTPDSKPRGGGAAGGDGAVAIGPLLVPDPPATTPAATRVATAPIARPPPRSGAFGWPVQGPVLSAFGATEDGLHNDGVNIAAPAGTSVVAAEAGVVAYAGNEIKGYGNLLLIKHDGGFMTAYAHAQAFLVGRGSLVQRGQAIARVGQSGGVDRPQLHFEIRKNGRPVDPRPYLEGRRVAQR